MVHSVLLAEFPGYEGQWEADLQHGYGSSAFSRCTSVAFTLVGYDKQTFDLGCGGFRKVL